jgi:hypothetical protein
MIEKDQRGCHIRSLIVFVNQEIALEVPVEVGIFLYLTKCVTEEKMKIAMRIWGQRCMMGNFTPVVLVQSY